MRFQRTSSPFNWCSYIARFPSFSPSPASCAETARARSITRESRLAVPKHSSDEALVRIAGATTIVNAVNGFSAGNAIPAPLLNNFRRCGSRFYQWNIHQMLAQEPHLQLVATEYFANHQVIGSVVAKLAGATRQFMALADHNLVPVDQARELHRNILATRDRKSTRLNSSHLVISYAVFCLKKKNNETQSN